MLLDRLDLNKLYTFFAVAEEGGVAGAARRLARTRSAVSQSLSALEDSLDVRLFERVGKRMVLTREGQLLQRRFGDYQAMLQRTVDDLRNEDGDVRGVVRLGLFLGFPSVRLAELVTRFTTRYPRTRIRVAHSAQEVLARRLLEHRLDYVVSFRPRSDASPRVLSTRLFEQELVLVSSRRFFRAGFDPAELSSLPVIDYFQSDPLIRRWLQHHTGQTPSAVDVRVWAATTDLVLELLLQHAGVGVVPRYLAEPWVRRRRLRIVATDAPALRDSIWLNELREARPTPVGTAFREAVLEEFAGAQAESAS